MFNAALSVFARAGSVQSAVDTLDCMRTLALPPNPDTARLALEACTQGGNTQKRAELGAQFRAMRLHS